MSQSAAPPTPPEPRPHERHSRPAPATDPGHNNVQNEEEEEEDPWETRIRDTGCYDENERLQNCFHDKHDWRACREEMEAFRQCYAKKPQNAR